MVTRARPPLFDVSVTVSSALVQEREKLKRVAFFETHTMRILDPKGHIPWELLWFEIVGARDSRIGE